MDKKNTIIGVLLLAAGFALMIFLSRTAPPAPPAPDLVKSTSGAPVGENQAPGPATAALPAQSPTNAVLTQATPATTGPANIIKLQNEYIEARFTDMGGAIESVALKKYPALKNSPEPFVLNRENADPILAFTQDSFPGLDRSARYQVVSQSATEVVFRAVFENRLEVTRRYVLSPNETVPGKSDPYVIRHETTFRNLTDQLVALPRISVSVGTAGPSQGDEFGQFLNIASYDGEDLHLIERTEMDGGGFLASFGFGSKEPIPFRESTHSARWAAANSQFFVSIVTPEQPIVGIAARRIPLAPVGQSTTPAYGIAGSARLDLKPIPAGATERLGASVYVGPKVNDRLEDLGQGQDRVMQFDRWFFNKMLLSHVVSPFLLWLMNLCNSWVHNYGLAIIVMTLILKTVFLPLTLAAAKSSKRMTKIQPQMQAIREKYKDNPQKMNQATLELFREHRVNPMGGCLPILITIPFFVGFFVMLQSASELRFAEFLWAKDLSAPDTVAHLGPIPINIMPILMGVTMIIQMRLVPTPTVDNAQAKMFKLMPYFFALICYNFSCALALYSTVGNIFTIGQQLIINRMKDEPDAPAPAAAGGKRPMKNVTPGKEKAK
jgi:YidC/Oxa1 family membrane protein insertase